MRDIVDRLRSMADDANDVALDIDADLHREAAAEIVAHRDAFLQMERQWNAVQDLCQQQAAEIERLRAAHSDTERIATALLYEVSTLRRMLGMDALHVKMPRDLAARAALASARDVERGA